MHVLEITENVAKSYGYTKLYRINLNSTFGGMKNLKMLKWVLEKISNIQDLFHK